MNQVILYQQKNLRMAGSPDEPMLCAKDVCEVLGIVNWRDALTRVPADEKGVVTTDTLGGPQDLVYVNEPGFYRLVFMSRKPEAEAIKRKVFHEILPAIRKTGYYRSTGPETPAALLALPAGRRDVALERLEACEEVRAARRVVVCAKEIEQRKQGRRGWNWRTILRWYYRWLDSGCDPLSLAAYEGSYKPRIQS